ncbi:hypothetical protein PG2006B_1092 [Bifidobacterium animalis subsp. animalis]|uniref:hypothetical protein n=1 Tax=Bifidobacterium animalis TaxID=28025 RepID=UPI00101FACC7|nr:hypothetical protein [Bifidobacterium animalis]RYN13518.1 hypothetical protein PG2006B_1092 [Bifidobacterium animalis subsp. animalis]
MERIVAKMADAPAESTGETLTPTNRDGPTMIEVIQAIVDALEAMAQQSGVLSVTTNRLNLTNTTGMQQTDQVTAAIRRLHGMIDGNTSNTTDTRHQ